MLAQLDEAAWDFLVQVTPHQPDSADYDFAVTNSRSEAVFDVHLRSESVMVLGQFGLDDTHANERLPALHVGDLGPHESRTCVQQRAGPLRRYEGARVMAIPASFQIDVEETRKEVVGKARMTIIGPPHEYVAQTSPVSRKGLVAGVLAVAGLALVALGAITVLAVRH
jgi:hypothetical protein